MAKKSFRPSPKALLNPRCDATFKVMFTLDTEESNFALKDFISTILGRNVSEIHLMPNEPAVDVSDENQMSFDVSVKFDDGEMVDIEMQTRMQDYDYAIRAEIQVARLLSVMNKKGDNWMTPAAYQISVLNFEFDKDDDSPLSWYSMRNENGKILSDRLNVIFFDLIKIHRLLGKPLESLSKIEKWGLFLSYADDERYAEYIEKIVETEEGLMDAKKSLCTVSEDEINWVRQNSIFIAQRDYNTIIYNSEKRGLERGLQKGIQQGIEKGLLQGAHDKAVESARNALALGLSVEQVSKITGLSENEISALK